ncbi:MAG: N-acetyltransferase [Actinobacteria bacterium]|nr:N-acetyltransferase [Actinomycetota bacterium]
MNLQVRLNEGDRRYELLSDDGELIGLIDYRLTGSLIDLFHAETNPAHGGKGYGSMLAQGALDDIRARGLTVRPGCPFIADYLDKHPEYQDLL